jgi:hypothetical protein
MDHRKTVQTIAFFTWIKDTNQRAQAANSSNEHIVLGDDDDESVAVGEEGNVRIHRPHLVVVPASVLTNWLQECKRFAPHLNVVKYHGTQAERLEMQNQLSIHLPGKEKQRNCLGIEPLDAIIAPIGYYEKEKGNDRTFLRKFKFDYLIVDEAHSLKNASGNRYKNLDKVSTLHRLMLTGEYESDDTRPSVNSLRGLILTFSFISVRHAGPKLTKRTSRTSVLSYAVVLKEVIGLRYRIDERWRGVNATTFCHIGGRKGQH